MTTHTAVATEFMQLEAQDQVQPDLAWYSVTVRPEFNTENFMTIAFRASDTQRNGLTSELPEWDDNKETWANGAVAWSVPTPDSDDRPEGLPILARAVLPYLEPRYGDAYVAFTIELPEEEG